jgi:hypothetical protein
MRHVKSKAKAFEMATERAQRLGDDQVVIDLNDGRYAVGSEKKKTFWYPDALCWYVRHIY